ncbi:hypothetical protein ACFYST_15495 [Kitasatospora sp. NPDC004614]|uniref:hypothetical protein n=1 Tax=unclassified Kitasatospora TaxID=2633591 RepID=UPI003695D4F3
MYGPEPQKDLGLPVPTGRELVAGLVSASVGPWWRNRAALRAKRFLVVGLVGVTVDPGILGP